MAQFKDEPIRDAPQLRPFLLQDVRWTGVTLDGGSYGAVEELEMAGLVCAGKKIYEALMDASSNEGTKRLVDKYHNECRFLSELRHPHIVQFLGLCFFPDSHIPLLVMERLHTSLHDFLLQYSDIPLHVKLSILHDVVFLHTRNPAVVHCDLTARSVVLDAAMTAKIAHLSNIRITNLHPRQLAETNPQTLAYMPPEASEGKMTHFVSYKSCSL